MDIPVATRSLSSHTCYKHRYDCLCHYDDDIDIYYLIHFLVDHYSMSRTLPTRWHLTSIMKITILLTIKGTILLEQITHCYIIEIRTLPFLTFLSLLSHDYQSCYHLTLCRSLSSSIAIKNIQHLEIIKPLVINCRENMYSSL